MLAVKVAPESRFLLLVREPASKVTVCATLSFFVHVPVPPTRTATGSGLKAKPWIDTTAFMVAAPPPGETTDAVVGPAAGVDGELLHAASPAATSRTRVRVPTVRVRMVPPGSSPIPGASVSRVVLAGADRPPRAVAMPGGLGPIRRSAARRGVHPRRHRPAGTTCACAGSARRRSTDRESQCWPRPVREPVRVRDLVRLGHHGRLRVVRLAVQHPGHRARGPAGGPRAAALRDHPGRRAVAAGPRAAEQRPAHAACVHGGALVRGGMRVLRRGGALPAAPTRAVAPPVP